MANYNNFGIERKWRLPSFPGIKALEGELYPGDRLEFDRDGLYAHWGIYVGQYNGMRHAVIHFGMFEGSAAFSKKKISGIGSSANRKPEIRADTIGQILGGTGKVRINNSRDKSEQPLDPDDVANIAKRMHRDKTPIDYSILTNNCEHFVNLCRYGQPHSEQADALVVAAVGVIGLFAVAAFDAIMRPSTQRR